MEKQTVSSKIDLIQPDFALMSVSNKSGLLELGQSFQNRGIEIISTGGTFKTLENGGVSVQEVAEYSGEPEMFGGRVKTLNPKIHGGLLANMSLPDDIDTLVEKGIRKIDILIGNLYPFEENLQKYRNGEITEEELNEKIDIGGSVMIRAAAKNHRYTTVVIDPTDYLALERELDQNEGATSYEFRKDLAGKVFNYMACYDGLIAQNLGTKGSTHTAIPLSNPQKLRYGENPHQESTLWQIGGSTPTGIPGAEQIQGKEMSHNNYGDANAAYNIISDFGNDEPTCCILKHANPCGLATRATIGEAYKVAYESDSESAFGGIIAVNREIDEDLANEISTLFCEVIIAPAVSDKAREIFSKKENLRVLIVDDTEKSSYNQQIRSISGGGVLIQDADDVVTGEDDVEYKTSHTPTPSQMQDLLFAFTAVKHIPSNGVVIVQEQTMIAPGAGQSSRVKSLRLACKKMQEMKEQDTGFLGDDLVMASDAFFPNIDNIELAGEVGIKAIIVPGGSRADEKVIEKAEELGIALVFTKTRHFKH